MHCTFCDAPLSPDEEYQSAEEHLRNRKQLAESDQPPEDPEEGFLPICRECRASVDENLADIEREAQLAAAASHLSAQLLFAIGLAVAFVLAVYFSVFS